VIVELKVASQSLHRLDDRLISLQVDGPGRLRPPGAQGGTVMYFGVSPQDSLIQVNPFVINENELSILGSFNNQFDTARVVVMLTSGVRRVGNLISHRLALSEYLQVFHLFGGRDKLKMIVSMNLFGGTLGAPLVPAAE